MTPAIRQTLQTTQGGDHAGLILCRYLEQQEKDGEKSSRTTLYNRAKSATANALPVYRKAFDRWKEAWTESSSKREFVLENRMIIGLGSDNVLEAGLTLHHTYGVPYIPGSAVKGLCAHYCNELGGEFQEGSELHTTIFGDTKRAGMIRFHDALIVPESLTNCLKDDVMTRHHGDYYDSKDETAPRDFDSPVPVTFLSVSGKFLFVISCDDVDESDMITPLGKKWIEFVWTLLAGALSNKGIGGKTGSGYGFGALKDLPKHPEPIQEMLKKGTVKKLTRSPSKDATKYGKKLLLVDEKDNYCVVRKNEEDAIKQLAPQAGATVELVYEEEVTHGAVKFLLFRLPSE